jgi:serine/threonine-protein kinase RsbW
MNAGMGDSEHFRKIQPAANDRHVALRHDRKSCQVDRSASRLGGVWVKQFEVRIFNRWDDMPVVTSMLSRFGAAHGLVPPVLHDLHVVLDEALNNIIAYAYGDGARGAITVRLEYRKDEIAMVLEDRGRAFDPLQTPAPELTPPLRTRKVGGLGVHFMRTLMDDVAYARVGDVNQLRLTKKMTA